MRRQCVPGPPFGPGDEANYYNNIIYNVKQVRAEMVVVCYQCFKMSRGKQLWLTGQKMAFLTMGNVAERQVAGDITGNNPLCRIYDISYYMSCRG